jgi:hypothetical protein
MIEFSGKIVQRPPDAEKIAKNIDFGTAVGLTQTAKDGQGAVVSALKSTFTLRGTWFEQQNKFGIKVKPATKADLRAEIRTQADWLEIHEEGGDKTGLRGRIAVPTDNVRRNKRLIIPKAMRPAALRGKRTFIIKTKHGDVIFQRTGKGKRSKIKALYDLESKVHIKKQSTFYDPLQVIVQKTLSRNIEAGIAKAIATMRP